MKNTNTQKVVLPTGDTSGKATAPAFAQIMNLLINALTKLGLLKEDLDYNVVRASMLRDLFSPLTRRLTGTGKEGS